VIRVGCAGFPVARERYWRALSFVEADTGGRMPRPDTLAGWRADMPAGAEASVQVYRLVTHGPEDGGFPAAGRALPKRRQPGCGAFRDTLEVYEAWLATRDAAKALGARFAVFETPPSFQPGPDRLRDLYRFFKGLKRGELTLIWQPRGAAWAKLGERVCADLGLVRGFDPLREPPPRGRVLYARPSLARGGVLDVDKLATSGALDGERPVYVALGHAAAFRDAERLLERMEARS
jgi:uncharacterized protein YecE (DUF72 family)